jgi:hypothetical protein
MTSRTANCESLAAVYNFLLFLPSSSQTILSTSFSDIPGPTSVFFPQRERQNFVPEKENPPVVVLYLSGSGMYKGDGMLRDVELNSSLSSRILSPLNLTMDIIAMCCCLFSALQLASVMPTDMLLIVVAVMNN